MSGKRTTASVVVKEEEEIGKNALRFFIPVIWEKVLFVA
jgi:hypothetical protein